MFIDRWHRFILREQTYEGGKENGITKLLAFTMRVLYGLVNWQLLMIDTGMRAETKDAITLPPAVLLTTQPTT